MKFLQQIFSYGCGRGEQTLRAPGSLHPLFLVPVIAWFFLVAGVFGFLPPASLVGLLLAHQLLSAVALSQSAEVRRMGFSGFLLAIPLSGLVHLTYGLGFCRGLVSALGRGGQRLGSLGTNQNSR